jgi:hypothetical protein
MAPPRHSLCQKQLERKHVILNEVKDLDPEIQVVPECKNEIPFDLLRAGFGFASE